MRETCLVSIRSPPQLPLCYYASSYNGGGKRRTKTKRVKRLTDVCILCGELIRPISCYNIYNLSIANTVRNVAATLQFQVCVC